MINESMYILYVAQIIRQRHIELGIHPNTSQLLMRHDASQVPSAPLAYTLHKEAARLGISFFFAVDRIWATVAEPGTTCVSRDKFCIQRRDLCVEVIRRWKPGDKLTIQATLHTPRFETLRRIMQQFPEVVVRIDGRGMALLNLERYPIQNTIHCTQCQRMLPVECFSGSKRDVDESICDACEPKPRRPGRPRTTTSVKQPRATLDVLEHEPVITNISDTELWHTIEPQLLEVCSQDVVVDNTSVYNGVHKPLWMALLNLYRRLKWLWWKVFGPNAN